LFWRDLARHLGSDQPFYALQPQGLDGKEPLHSRIEEMATHYIREIRTLQPKGPYYIGGHCIGGLIAFEMAQQLHAQGETVGLLALFDAYAPRREKSVQSSLLYHCRRKAIRAFETIGLHVANLLVLKSGERLPYIRTKFTKALYKLYMGVGSAWIPAARKRQEVMAAATRAAKTYDAKAYPGKITLFRATNLGGSIKHDPQMGWSRLAGGGMESHLIPGYHAHIVLEPRVRVLGQELTAALCQAQQSGAGEPLVRTQKPQDREPSILFK
jgi:thioesterase domain-containing protein